MMRKWMKKSLLAGFLGACICGIAGCGGNKEESYRVIEIMQLEGTAVVTLNAETADEVLKKAVEDQDYKVTGIE